MIQRSVRLFLMIAALWLAFPTRVDAYLDPGTGSSILQLVLAGIFAVSFCVSLAWARVKSWVARIRGDHPEPDQEKNS
ncbi:MAG TPA: hypothetical protein PLP42_18035 [Acidobacteriota bacterium]|nr:hypothetical protein [Acidobacteriota bacterium]